MRVSPLALLAVLAAGSSACSAPAAPPRAPLWRPPPPAPAAPVASAPSRPVNAFALQSLQGSRCPPRQVAPGEWATFDCGGVRPAARALALAPRFSLLSGPLPLAVDHRAEGSEGPIKSQGAVGACTAFSLSSAMDNAVRRMGRADVISPLHVWSKYAVPEMGTAGDDTVDQSITLEPSWPYDPAKACKMTRDPLDSCSQAYGVASASASFDPSLRAEQALADASGRYRLQAIEQLHTRPADVGELSAILAGGDDVWASFWVNDDAWSNRSAENPVIPDYVTDSDAGHAVVLAGYRTLPGGSKQFLVHNSWSPRWGESGYGWISEAMVSKYLRSAYKVRVVDSAGPSIPSLPGSGGCPSGQVKDAVLGTCAALCPSGSPPAAGICLPTVPGFPAPGALPSIPGLPSLPNGPFPLPLPLPQPGPAPQSACPQGQAPDLMTGQCTSFCPGGAPAIGGMCLPIGR